MSKQSIFDQLATNRALYKAARESEDMSHIPAGQMLMSAAMIERQKVNADGYPQAGGSYGNYQMQEASLLALNSALLIQTGVKGNPSPKEIAAGIYKRNYTYSYYAGGSYGKFINEIPTAKKDHERMLTATFSTETAQGNTDTTGKSQSQGSSFMALLKKYKLIVIAAVCTVIYFVFRKK